MANDITKTLFSYAGWYFLPNVRSFAFEGIWRLDPTEPQKLI